MRRLFRLRLYAMLGIAIVVMSFAGTLIKLTHAPALVIATWRLWISTVVLLPWAYRIRVKLKQVGPLWHWVWLSGGMLALHFATWVLSLKFTTVASSIVLVTTSPLFVGVGSYLFLKEKPSASLMLGIVVSVIGGVVIGYGDFRLSGQALLGDGLALLGALSAAAYFLIGRRLRPHLALGAYIVPVYGACALFLLGTTLLLGERLTGYPPHTYGLFALLALGPQLIGHSTLNWSLKYLSAGAVAVATLGEPIGAALIAYWVLGEPLTDMTLVGGGLILAGVYFALRAESLRVSPHKKKAPVGLQGPF